MVLILVQERMYGNEYRIGNKRFRLDARVGAEVQTVAQRVKSVTRDGESAYRF